MHRPAALTALVLSLVVAAGAQVVIAEQEINAFDNDAFAMAEDCINVGNQFQITGTYILGNQYGDIDFYRFNADMGATLSLDMTVTLSVGGLQHIFYLFDAQQRLVAAWNNVSAAPANASIGINPYTIPATGTYYIGLTEWSVAPSAFAQVLAFTPLAMRGYSVANAQPNATFNTAGGNQIAGTRYTITVNVTAGNSPQVPMCTVTAPAPGTPGTRDVTIMFDAADPQNDPVTATFEYSNDGGVTYFPCTAAASSPLPNPAPGLTTPLVGGTFVWDSRGDGAGMAAIENIDVRVTVADPTTMSNCTVAGLVIDNTALCGGICGDCDLGGTGPDIIDALTAAQIGAQIVVPTMTQQGCCDVDSNMIVDVIDALRTAQVAAQLPMTLTCP